MKAATLPATMRAHAGSILIVDDDEPQRRGLRRLVEQAGYQALEAGAVAEARKQLKAHDVDVVVLDVGLPDASGLTLLNDVAQLQHPAAVVVLTGSQANTDMRAALAKGVVSYLSKSADSLTIFAQIEIARQRARDWRMAAQERGKLEDSLAEAKSRWNELPQGLSHALCAAWDLRHIETGAHVRRIGAYSEVLASALGWSRPEAAALGEVAVLHDVGKIAIPDTILCKPGQLTKEEFDVMKRHTVEGAKMLGAVAHPFFERAALVALRHHERWDGSGYPDGQRGEECALDARIVSVADVYDALGHARCYKAAWTDEKIRSFFREGSGKLFEARIVDALFDSLPRLQQLARELPESATFPAAFPRAATATG